ncbi:MAG TPA: mannose-1-phosphate guanylyltransferase [Terriglobales bacterium]|nr:mannose-1-phosphate guanylyltransferase [Terriglobales bacterium]
MAKTSSPKFYPVILAGGRGTRFWPLSRKKLAKQLLPLNSEKKTMIQETIERLLPVAPAEQCWIITNSDLRDNILRQVKKVPKRQVIAEPVGRNTAPAIGLAAFILLHRDPDAILGLFPSDQAINGEKQFRRDLETAVKVAAAGENIVVMGIKPTRPETGYGYIETGATFQNEVVRVRRFTEKPRLDMAKEFLESGRYYWNSGMFVWAASTLAAALREYLPKTAKALEAIASTHGTSKFESTFRRLYPQCDNISVDYGIMEPRSARGEASANIYCVPADFAWNDLGSWAALFEHHTRDHSKNVMRVDSDFLLDTEGNYIHAPGKFVAAVGVKNLVVVDTGDALLITTRERAQDVGKIVKYLDEKKFTKLV